MILIDDIKNTTTYKYKAKVVEECPKIKISEYILCSIVFVDNERQMLLQV
jgi:hypothetical protein